MEVKQKWRAISSAKVMRLSKGQNLYDLSNKLDQYQGFVISQIDANQDTVEFTNGLMC
jgi:type III restriction enzyme